MRFENIQYLYFLSMAVLPALIYLIFRKKPRKLIFGSLFLLRDITKRTRRKTRIKDIILLILRTLLLIFVVMVFAKPFTGSSAGSDPSKRTVTAAYLDTSPSMADSFSGGNKLDEARNLLSGIISGSDRSDLYFIATSDPSHFFKGNREDAVRFVSETGIYGRDRDFYEITSIADSALAEYPDRNRIFLIITDGFMRIENTEDMKSPTDAKAFIFRTDKDEREDISIESVSVRASDMLEIEISSTGRGSAHLGVYREGRKVHAENLNFEGESSKTVNADLSAFRNSGSAVSVKTDNSYNPLTSTFDLVIPEVRKKEILIVGDRNSYPVRGILSLMNISSDSLFHADVISPDEINSVSFAAYDMILFNDMSRFTGFTVSNLRTFLSSGKGIYFIADRKLNLSDYNSILVPDLGLPPVKGLESSAGDFSGITIADPGHPVFRDVFLDGRYEPSTVEIYSYYKIDPEGWKTVISTSKDPLLIEKEQFGGKIFMLVAGLDTGDSNIINNGIAVPVLFNSMLHLTSSTDGSQISKTVGDRIEFGTHVFLIPEGRSHDPLRDEYSKIFELKRPGFFKIYDSGGRRTGMIAVNSERESFDDHTSLLDQMYPVTIISEEDAGNITGDGLLKKRDLTMLLLFASILMLALEILIVRFL